MPPEEDPVNDYFHPHRERKPHPTLRRRVIGLLLLSVVLWAASVATLAGAFGAVTPWYPLQVGTLIAAFWAGFWGFLLAAAVARTLRRLRAERQR